LKDEIKKKLRKKITLKYEIEKKSKREKKDKKKTNSSQPKLNFQTHDICDYPIESKQKKL
jgi:hypothetical protein